MARLIIHLKDGSTITAETENLNFLASEPRQTANRLLYLDGGFKRQTVPLAELARFEVVLDAVEVDLLAGYPPLE